jgi:hypothetical protein
VDELALDFDDVYLLVVDGVGVGVGPPMSTETMSDLKAIHDSLSKMSDTESLWKNEALRVAPEWERIRQFAGAALARLSAT